MDVPILVENQLLKVILVKGDENGGGLMPLEEPQHQARQVALLLLRDRPLYDHVCRHSIKMQSGVSDLHKG